MNAFRAVLEARDLARNHLRAYRLEAGPDLFGTWLVDITYGRIGTRGRRLRYVAGNEAEARKLVRKCLRRRASARNRIGVSYRICELIDPDQWLPILVEQGVGPAAPGTAQVGGVRP